MDYVSDSERSHYVALLVRFSFNIIKEREKLVNILCNF